MAKVSLSALSDMDYHRLLPHGYTGQIITADKFGIVPSELFDLSFDRATTSCIANVFSLEPPVNFRMQLGPLSS
jgi:hypothetical protein